jgi:hypothetical protein
MTPFYAIMTAAQLREIRAGEIAFRTINVTREHAFYISRKVESIRKWRYK